MTKTFAASHAWIRRGEKYLFLHRASSTRYRPGFWDIPGGTVEPGESPEEALTREISEETKIDIEIGKPLFIYNNLTQFPDRQTFQIVFECLYLGGSVSLHDSEHQGYDWLTPLEARGLKLIEFTQSFLDRDYPTTLLSN